MNGIHCKHLHRGALLMVEHMTWRQHRLTQDVLWWGDFCVEVCFFSKLLKVQCQLTCCDFLLTGTERLGHLVGHSKARICSVAQLLLSMSF